MPNVHPIDLLGAYVNDELAPTDAAEIRAHLRECLECRRIADALRAGIAEVRGLPVVEPPAGLWSDIERSLTTQPTAVPGKTLVKRSWPRRVVGIAVGAAGAAIAASLLLGLHHGTWSVEQISGTPTAGARTVVRTDDLAEGEWLETDGASRAKLSIGTLGTAEVGPGSRVRLVQAGGAARTLEVQRGSIHARVWAPPRFFLVETPAATAVDLGCIYSLDIDERGNGVLLVRSGQVQLAGAGRTSLVVAGTAAAMRTGAGPGTPYSTHESQSFRDALAVLDFGGQAREEALVRVIAEATARSTISLWHLMTRVSPDERVRIYDRLAALSAPPRGVHRDAVLALDSDALARYRTSLEPAWSTERVRLWKRAWRAFWSIARGE